MSYCKSFGKDKVFFVAAEDHEKPSTVELPPPVTPQGLITDTGDINWGCPCLGGMATGPCNVEFRNAFSCFHYSTAEPKASDCFEAFTAMRDCFNKYPTVYNQTDDNDGDNDNVLNMTAMDDEAETARNVQESSIEAVTVEKKIN